MANVDVFCERACGERYPAPARSVSSSHGTPYRRLRDPNRTRVGGLFVVTLAVAISMLVSVSPASASWGNGHCTINDEHHCYALTRWAMEDPPESVKGAEDIVTTNSVNVPEFSNGSFVDDEMWVAFKSSGGWLEIGQTAGDGENCCTLWPFVALALKGNSEGYEEYVWDHHFGTPVEASPTNLYKVEDPSANGTWCWYIWNNQVGCHAKPGYWNNYSDLLEAGIEAASNSRPYNEGSQEVDAIFHEGSHHEWKGSRTEAEGYVTPSAEMCESPNWSSNYRGNAIWWIC